MYSLIVLQIKKPLFIFDVSNIDFLYIRVALKVKDETYHNEKVDGLDKIVKQYSDIFNKNYPFENTISIKCFYKNRCALERIEWKKSNVPMSRKIKVKKIKLFNYDEKVSDLDRMLKIIQNEKNLITNVTNSKEFLYLAFRYFSNNNLESINLDYVYDDLLNDDFFAFLECLKKFLNLDSSSIFQNYYSWSKINRIKQNTRSYLNLLSFINDDGLVFSSDEHIKRDYPYKFDTLISHLVALKKNCGIIESGNIFWPDGEITYI
jgi:hypothetical protein